MLFCATMSYSQVGIGTTTPDASSALDITSNSSGILIPRLTSAQRDAIANPANGLLIFNTDSDEFQFNSNTTTNPVWKAFSLTTTSSSTSGQSVKYSNTDTSTNVNQTSAINLPTFGKEEWNDNTTLYAVNTESNTITINEAGRYKIIANASVVVTSNNARTSPEMYISVNGTQVGTTATTGYMRRSNGTNESSLHLTEVIELQANDTISISILRAGNSGTVRLRAAGTTNIYVEKLH